MKQIIEDLHKRCTDLAEKISRNEIDPASSDPVIDEIKAAMQQHPEARAELGAIIAKLNSLKKHRSQEIEKIKWIDILGGRMSIGHRPALKKFRPMKQQGVTHILTLLWEKEGAREIENTAKHAGIEWLWLPLPSGAPPDENRKPEVLAIFQKCREALNTGAGIYIHCSAGIHRTGMVAYALLRYSGMNSDDAMKSLAELREITHGEMRDHRQEWGDQFGR